MSASTLCACAQSVYAFRGRGKSMWFVRLCKVQMICPTSLRRKYSTRVRAYKYPVHPLKRDSKISERQKTEERDRKVESIGLLLFTQPRKAEDVYATAQSL